MISCKMNIYILLAIITTKQHPKHAPKMNGRKYEEVRSRPCRSLKEGLANFQSGDFQRILTLDVGFKKDKNSESAKIEDFAMDYNPLTRLTHDDA